MEDSKFGSSMVSSQPAPKGTMDVYITGDSYHRNQCHGHGHCERRSTLQRLNSKRSRLLCRVAPIVLLLSLIALAAFAVSTCSKGALEMFGVSDGELAKRATEAFTGGNNTFVNRKCACLYRCRPTHQSSMTQNTDYLIAVFVGLLVVVVLGICLSAWCCKGTIGPPFAPRSVPY